MLNLPKGIIQVLRHFEEAFSERVWEWAKVLVIGAILAPGERTVTAILRVMGLSHERQFQHYHRVLNRAKWSSRALSGMLLHMLVAVFVSKEAPIVVGIDETIERRRGARIATKGIYRDAEQREQRVFRENQRVAMDLDAAVGTHSLGWACVGVALFHGAGPQTRATIRSIDGATKNSLIGDGK